MISDGLIISVALHVAAVVSADAKEEVTDVEEEVNDVAEEVADGAGEVTVAEVA